MGFEKDGDVMSKRGELLQAFLEKGFSYDMIMAYTDRLNSVPEDQREKMAESLLVEIANINSAKKKENAW